MNPGPLIQQTLMPAQIAPQGLPCDGKKWAFVAQGNFSVGAELDIEAKDVHKPSRPLLGLELMVRPCNLTPLGSVLSNL